LDEVFVQTNGERRYLWWAIDREGEVLESLVTKRLNCMAIWKFYVKR
jgi:putative transposase